MRQFCDLNIQESASYADNLDNVKQLMALGYNMVALNRHYGCPKKEREKKKSPHEKNSMEDARKYVQEVEKLHERLKADIEVLRANNISNVDSAQDIKVPEKFKFFSRLTFEIDHQDQLSYLRSHSNKLIMAAFDLIAVHPKCEKVFRSLMEGKLDFDIITFPMEEKFPFRLDRHQIGLGISKGIAFEVNYGKAIKSQSLRKYIFSSSQNLVAKTKRGAGIIVSSGGECVMDFRAPPDVANLCNLFRLNGSLGLDAVSKTPHKMITRALLRRETFKGAVKVEKIEEEEKNVDEEEPRAKKRKI